MAYNSKQNKTIIFTGGHHNSALYIAKYFKKKGYNIIWFGHRFASLKNKNVSQEYLDVINNGIKFIDLKTAKIHNNNLFSYLKTLFSIFWCHSLLQVEKPQAIISFGGYLSVPPVIAAWFLRIPSFGHEQTVAIGRANSFLLKFYRKLFITWPNDKLEKNKKVLRTGLPFPSSHFKIIKKTDLNQFLSKNKLSIFANTNKPLIVISGGKQGCHIINQIIEKNLEIVLDRYNLFHQTGNNSETNDYHRLLKKREVLGEDLQKSYILTPYFNHFTQIMSAADLVIGRSGAHTIYEILILQKKMIAIPLPETSSDEQLKNANLLKDIGLATVIPQQKLNSEYLFSEIEKSLHNNIDSAKIAKYINQNIIKNSSEIIVSEVEKYLTS